MSLGLPQKILGTQKAGTPTTGEMGTLTTFVLKRDVIRKDILFSGLPL